MTWAASGNWREVLGACLAKPLKAARFVFREPTGKLVFHVEQASPLSFWHYTKVRGALALELVWSDAAGGGKLRLARGLWWWKSKWELKEFFGGELFSFVPSSFWGTSWTVTNARNGAVAVARVANPFIVGPQEAVIESLSGETLARLQWHGYAWCWNCHRNVRVELADENWELAALAFAVIRWVAMQQR